MKGKCLVIVFVSLELKMHKALKSILQKPLISCLESSNILAFEQTQKVHHNHFLFNRPGNILRMENYRHIQKFIQNFSCGLWDKNVGLWEKSLKPF